MSDKRRRARVQGSWAAPPCKSQPSKPHRDPQGSVTTDNTTGAFNRTPAWLSKNVDNPLPSSDRYIYEPQDEEFKEKLAPIVIDKSGVYDISTQPSGLSRLRFFTNFLDTRQADELYDRLYNELPWQQLSGVHKGQRYLQPRLNAYYSDVAYNYSGTSLPASPDWPKALLELKGQLEESTGLQFNGVLANLYRSEHDSVAWHSDDEPELGPDPTVVSISLGATRNFCLRKKPMDRLSGDYSDCPHYRVPLPHGSLLIMEGSTQPDWQHCVPKEYHAREPRINLTFRAFIKE